MSQTPFKNGREALPDDPILVRLWRGEFVESQHRGAWCLVDARGEVIEAGGSVEHPFFVRSSIKALQAIPLVELGAAEALGYSEEELCMALASHNAEDCHTGTVRALLARLEFSVQDLQCGAHEPGDSRARIALAASGEEPTALHNNCSGKHAGFLALSKHLDVPTSDYLDPDGVVQSHVRAAIGEMCGVDGESLTRGIDGCSAPTYRLPLQALALAFARIVEPSGLKPERRGACEQMLKAVAAHPILIAGSRGRLCTELSRVTEGRLFPKIGAEGVYAVGDRGSGRALAVKITDGGRRALHPLVVELLARFEMIDEAQARALESWSQSEIKNHAGLKVGRTEVVA
jgi:L-asparaginase II